MSSSDAASMRQRKASSFGTIVERLACGVGSHSRAELGARTNSELAIGVGQVRLDSLVTHERSLCDLPVGESAGCELCDAELAGRERGGSAAPRFDDREFDLSLRQIVGSAETLEDLERLPQRFACCSPLPGAAKETSLCEQRTAELEGKAPRLHDVESVESRQGRHNVSLGCEHVR